MTWGGVTVGSEAHEHICTTWKDRNTGEGRVRWGGGWCKKILTQFSKTTLG